VAGIGFKAESPIPRLAASDGGKSNVANERERAIGRIEPGNTSGKITDDFPLGKDTLDLRSVSERERAEEKARSIEGRSHPQTCAVAAIDRDNSIVPVREIPFRCSCADYG
jgi:hypothetical protein